MLVRRSHGVLPDPDRCEPAVGKRTREHDEREDREDPPVVDCAQVSRHQRHGHERKRDPDEIDAAAESTAANHGRTDWGVEHIDRR